MSDQLTRDQLLQQRLLAATNDCAAATKSLSALADIPPHAGRDQEERLRGIENSLSLIRWNCDALKRYTESKG